MIRIEFYNIIRNYTHFKIYHSVVIYLIMFNLTEIEMEILNSCDLH